MLTSCGLHHIGFTVDLLYCLGLVFLIVKRCHSGICRSTLPYLTLPSGWAGCYTWTALRPYRLGPMRKYVGGTIQIFSIDWLVSASDLVELVYRETIRNEELLWKRKGSHREFRKENFFGIPKSSDIGRSLENVLGKFPECGPWSLT